MQVLRASIAVFIISTALALEGSGSSGEENSDDVATILTNSSAIETRNNGSTSVTMRDVISKLACFSCKSLFREMPKHFDDRHSTKSLKNRHAELFRSVCFHDETWDSCTKQLHEVTARLRKIVSDQEEVYEGFLFSFRRIVKGKKTKTSILREACYDTSICNDEGDERIRQLSNTTNIRNETSIKEWVKTIANDFIYAPIVDGTLSTIMGIKEDRNDPEDDEDIDFDLKLTKEELLNKYSNQLNLRYGLNKHELIQNSIKTPFSGLASLFTIPQGFHRISKALEGISKKFDKETACFKPKLCLDAVNQRVFSVFARLNRATTSVSFYPFASEIMQLRFERDADVEEALYGVLEM